MHYADTVGAGKICESIVRFRKIPGLEYWKGVKLLKYMEKNGTRFAD